MEHPTKRKQNSCNPGSSENNPIIVVARQRVVICTDPSDIALTLKCTKQDGYYYPFMGVQQSRPDEWKVQFSKAGNALITATLHDAVIAEIYLKIVGYNRQSILPINLILNLEGLQQTTKLPKTTNEAETVQVGCAEAAVDLPLFDLAPSTELSAPAITKAAELFPNEHIPSHCRKHFKLTPNFAGTAEDWFWFSVRTGCKKLFLYLNFAHTSFLYQRNAYGELPLHVTLRSSKPQKLATLIVQMMGQDWSVRDYTGMTPLYLATASGKGEVARELMVRMPTLGSNPLNIMEVDPFRQPLWAMQQLVQFGTLHVSHGKLYSGTGWEGRKAQDLRGDEIYLAAEFGLVSEILKMEASVNKPNAWRGGGYPIHFAAMGGDVESLNLLMKLGASVSSCDGAGRQPSHVASMCTRQAVLELLMRCGAKIDCVDACGYQPIHLVRDSQVLTRLLELGAEVDAVNTKTGAQPIHCAVWCNLHKVAQKLVECGARVNVKDYSGMQPIHYCASYEVKLADEWKNYEMFEFLRRCGAQLDAKDNQGAQPVHYASERGKMLILSQLLSGGINVDVLDNEKRQPIHYATKGGSHEALKKLMKRGAKIDAIDSCGWQPIHFAAMQGHSTMVKALIDQGAKVDARDLSGAQPIHYAAGGGHSELVKNLVVWGADETAKTNGGQSVVDFALGAAATRKEVLASFTV